MEINKGYYILRKRLESTEKWMEGFLEVEKNREISRKALHEYYKQKPVFSFFFRLYTLPTFIITYFSDIIWWKRYWQAEREVEIIKKELESYEPN